jgi:hypothetical protein
MPQRRRRNRRERCRCQRQWIGWRNTPELRLQDPGSPRVKQRVKDKGFIAIGLSMNSSRSIRLSSHSSVSGHRRPAASARVVNRGLPDGAAPGDLALPKLRLILQT